MKFHQYGYLGFGLVGGFIIYHTASPVANPASNGKSNSPLDDAVKNKMVSLNASKILPKLKTTLSITAEGYKVLP